MDASRDIGSVDSVGYGGLDLAREKRIFFQRTIAVLFPGGRLTPPGGASGVGVNVGFEARDAL